MGSPLPVGPQEIVAPDPRLAQRQDPAREHDKTNHRRKLFVAAGASLGELQGFIRGNCIPEEIARMEEIATFWRQANSSYRNLQTSETNLFSQTTLEPPEPGLTSLLQEITAQPLFQSSYGEHRVRIMKVSTRNLVSCQRHVDLDYVRNLVAHLRSNAEPEAVARFCLLPPLPLETPKQLQIGPNAFCFSSPNTDFRFLGGYARPFTDRDVQSCWMGGQPAAMVVLMLGYGTPSMNAFKVGDRTILSNGFHRAYSLLSLGIEHAYVVVREITDLSTEFPPILGVVPSDQLLNHPRPVLTRDFFNKSLALELRGSPGLRNIQVAWNASQVNVPL